MTIDVLSISDGLPTASAADSELPTASAADSELPTVLSLWEAARERGWEVEPDPASQGWSASSGDRTAGMAYEPPSEFGTGVVGAFDRDRTVTWTGVTGPAEAVGLLRGFLGWPEGSA